MSATQPLRRKQSFQKTKAIEAPSSRFITSNPEALLFELGFIHITILGGIALSGLERLKVTLKISNAENHYHPIRQHLDLYHAEHLQRLVQLCNIRLEINSGLMEEVLQQLIAALENYRLQRMTSDKPSVATPELSLAEKEAALAYLQDPQLMQNTFNDLGKTGILGEEENRMIMFLVFLSRILKEPLHIISFGASGSGKTYLQERISKLIPAQHKIEITSFSANALYYFKSAELEHKLLLIEDMDGAQDVLYPLRELQSKQKLTKVISLKDSKGEIKKFTYTAEGSVCVAGCTTKENIYEDNANRSILIYIDGSAAQDKKIMDYQQCLSAGLINNEEEKKWQTLFLHINSLIKPIAVRNPFATQLHLPSQVFKPRRTNAMYLKFIEVITLYNSHQRIANGKEGREKYIETTLDDIAWANRLLKNVLLKKSDELSGATRHFLEKLKTHLKEKNYSTFKSRELRMELRINANNLKRYLPELVHNGYLKIVGGNRLHGYIYAINDNEEYQDLKNAVWKGMDEMLKNIK